MSKVPQVPKASIQAPAVFQALVCVFNLLWGGVDSVRWRLRSWITTNRRGYSHLMGNPGYDCCVAS